VLSEKGFQGREAVFTPLSRNFATIFFHKRHCEVMLEFTEVIRSTTRGRVKLSCGQKRGRGSTFNAAARHAMRVGHLSKGRSNLAGSSLFQLSHLQIIIF